VVNLHNIIQDVMRLYMVFELVDCDLKKLMDTVNCYNMNLNNPTGTSSGNDINAGAAPYDVFAIQNIQVSVMNLYVCIFVYI